MNVKHTSVPATYSGLTVLETKGLSVGYGNVAVASGLDLRVDAGEIVALLGPNGAGKTTTLHTIAGILPRIAGDVLYGQKPASGPLHFRAREGVLLVTEERAVIRRLTVRENLRLAGVESGTAFKLFPELMRLSNRRAGLLSGGEQQMLVLGRAIAADPRLLLVDELSFGLAPLIVQRLAQALRLAASQGVAVLLVEQHAALALANSDRGYVLSRGEIQLAGTATQLIAQLSDIERSYLTSAAKRPAARYGI